MIRISVTLDEPAILAAWHNHKAAGGSTPFLAYRRATAEELAQAILDDEDVAEVTLSLSLPGSES